MDEGQIVEVDPPLDVPAGVDVYVAASADEPWNEHRPVITVRGRRAEVLARPASLGLAAVERIRCLLDRLTAQQKENPCRPRG